MGHRVYGKNIEIDEKKVKDFFNARVKRNLPHRYNYVIYQDNNPELAMQRDEYEKDFINGIIDFKANAQVIDIGCGVGRWADFFKEKGINQYIGMDLSEELLKIARDSCVGDNFRFFQSSFSDVYETLKKEKLNLAYDYVLVNGVFLYINDAKIYKCMEVARNLTKSNGYIYIKDTIGTKSRLTLDEIQSKELESDYSAIYREKEEWDKWIKEYFLNWNFSIKSEGPIWPENMRNRSDTLQYYWVLYNNGVV